MAYYLIVIIAVLTVTLIIFNYLIVSAFNALVDLHNRLDEQSSYISRLEAENCELKKDKESLIKIGSDLLALNLSSSPLYEIPLFDLPVNREVPTFKVSRGIDRTEKPYDLGGATNSVPSVSISPEFVVKPSDVVPSIFGTVLETEKDLSTVTMFK